jgi:hypothetical protein
MSSTINLETRGVARPKRALISIKKAIIDKTLYKGFETLIILKIFFILGNYIRVKAQMSGWE